MAKLYINFSLDFFFLNLIVIRLSARLKVIRNYECVTIMKVYDTTGSNKVDDESYSRYFYIDVLMLWPFGFYLIGSLVPHLLA